MPRKKPERQLEYLARYPRICAHIIAHSLGYAAPDVAAAILKDAKEGKENYSEWILSCYGGNPREAVELAIRTRHMHTGYMASYKQALYIVRSQLKTGEGPVFASWF